MKIPKRKWKRWLILLAFVAVVVGGLNYCGFFVRPLKITRETAGLESLPEGVKVPLRWDGRSVDYVMAYEILFPQVSEITPENAWRDVVEALGPGILGQGWADSFQEGEQTRDSAQSRLYHQAQWREYCRRLGVATDDVNTQAAVYVSPQEAIEDCVERAKMENTPLHNEAFMETGWSREAYPELAAWVDTHSAALGVVAAAVRKSRYYMPYGMFNEDRYFHGNVGNGFAVRAAMFLHDNDVENALADIESLYRLAGHMSQMPDRTAQRIGARCGELAVHLTRQLLIRGLLTAAQLDTLAEVLASLPPPISFKHAIAVSDWWAYSLLGQMVEENDWRILGCAFSSLDPNVATQRFAALSAMRYDQSKRAEMAKICSRVDRYGHAWAYVTPSRTVAEWYFFANNASYADDYYGCVQRQTQRLHMARLAVALARYKLAEGACPENLAALVPGYVARVEMPPEDIPYLFDWGREHTLRSIEYETANGGFTLSAGEGYVIRVGQEQQ